MCRTVRRPKQGVAQLAVRTRLATDRLCLQVLTASLAATYFMYDSYRVLRPAAEVLVLQWRLLSLPQR